MDRDLISYCRMLLNDENIINIEEVKIFNPKVGNETILRIKNKDGETAIDIYSIFDCYSFIAGLKYKE